MEIELAPDPGADDAAARAVAAALTREGLADAERPAGSVGAWRRAGLRDAVERSVASNGRVAHSSPASSGSAVSGPALSGSPGVGYVPPPRSRRGALRA
jgi:hypothetical protein